MQRKKLKGMNWCIALAIGLSITAIPVQATEMNGSDVTENETVTVAETTETSMETTVETVEETEEIVETTETVTETTEEITEADETAMESEAETSGTCGTNLTWTLDSEGTLRINGTGNILAESFRSRYDIINVIISDGVTGIGDNAFYNCCYMKSIVVPNSVRFIGDGAFFECSKLETITLPKTIDSIGKNAFLNCDLTAIELPSNLKELSNGIFFNNDKLTEIQIPDSVEIIGEEAFKECSGLKEIVIPQSVHTIGRQAFKNCDELESVVIPNSVTSMGPEVYYDCDNLKKIVIGNGLKEISYGTFQYCNKLMDVTIGNQVEKIGSVVFCGCNSLEKIVLPNSVKKIDWAFCGCPSLISVTIPASVQEINEDEFEDSKYLTIYGYSDTEAEKFAQKKGFKFVSLGEAPREEKVKQFVSRMYTVVLNREAEAGGLDYWSQELLNQKQDGAALANGFINSPEFKNRGLSNSNYLDVLYETFFGRKADSDGKNYWLSEMRNGMSRNTVLAGFVNSKEFGAICESYGIARGTMENDGSSIYNAGVHDFVLRNYTKALGRDGEVEGVEYWSHLINTKQKSALDCAMDFFHSKEFMNKNLNDADYVEVLYETYFGRASDASGKNYWLSMLASGNSRDWVLSEFAHSPEFKNIMAQYGL